MATMKQWAVGEEVLAADFNNYVQNQVVPVFASATVRDTEWPSPPNGAVCVTLDTGTLYQRANAAWYTPFRRIQAQTRSSATTSASAETVALTTTASVIPGNRLLRVQAGWYNAVGGVGEACIVRIRTGNSTAGTLVNSAVINMAPSGVQQGTGSGGTLEGFWTPPAGSLGFCLTTASTTANAVALQAA